MKILYHTSDCEIKEPDIHYGRKNADFGQGFYLTPDKDFTYRWAGKNAVVNIYELDESGLTCMNLRVMKSGLNISLIIADQRTE